MNLSNINTIKELLNKYGFKFSKSLGQNFLINPLVCPRIAELGNATGGVIEIGTGFGVLTAELARRAKKVVAIEIDEKLIPVLSETLAEFDNVKVINADVMAVDLAALIADEFAGMEVCVCANLPYYITSPIIMGLLEKRLPITSITVMVQKEAADRLCAKMGTRECGAVTAAVRYYSDPTMLFSVSRGSFMPAPNVDSAVIRLDIKCQTDTSVCDEMTLFKLIRAAFSQRRKMLVNPVCAAFKTSKAAVQAAMTASDIKLTARAEELSMNQFVTLSNALVHANE